MFPPVKEEQKVPADFWCKDKSAEICPLDLRAQTSESLFGGKIAKAHTAGNIAGPATQAGLRGSPGPVMVMPNIHTAPKHGVQGAAAGTDTSCA